MPEINCPSCESGVRFTDGIWLYCRACGRKTFRAATDDRPLIYVATPYKDRDEANMISRFNLAIRVTGHLIKFGYDAYSPIVHNRVLAINCNLPHEIDYWSNFDRTMLTRSDVLLVVQASGWDRSEGIRWEMQVADKYQIPIIKAPPEQIFEVRRDSQELDLNLSMRIDI